MTISLESVSFATETETILHDISCTIESGSVVLVMGPSGSGKTLTLKILAGVVPPTGGDVRFDGVKLSSMTERELTAAHLRQGFVFQDSALWQNLSVYNNLTLPVQYHYPKRSAASIDERIQKLCRRMAFREDLSRRPALLSAGERKVASILRAMMLDPETLVMDEPSSSLDSGSSQRLLEILKELKAAGRTMVIASHDSRIASMLADFILVIDEGTVRAFDSVANITRTQDARVRELLSEVLDLSSTYDTDILDILGGSDSDPFA